jgi:hypothetical protein
MRVSFALALTLALAPVYSQPLTCNVSSDPTMVRLNGESELAGDVVLQCTGGTGLSLGVVNITLFLNVNLTSKLNAAGQSEALLLIDEPQPGVPNASNQCSPAYTGQVLGTPGIVACAAGSGNVYQANGGGTADNIVVWQGVPIVSPGPGAVRTLRLTNIRANAANIGLPGETIQALVQATSDVAIVMNQPVSGTTVATMNAGLNFTTGTPAGAVGVTDLIFAEEFPAAFLKRIENTPGGPLTALRQDIPGHIYCTDSGFTPEFSATTPGAIGSADTGTRLIAQFSSLPPSVFLLIVPNEVTSSSGLLVAHRVFPPFAADFTGGSIPLIPAVSIVSVSGHAAEVLYEVTANAPFQGVTGCAAKETFTVGVISLFSASLKSATITGRLAPIDSVMLPSATAPRPRFTP